MYSETDKHVRIIQKEKKSFCQQLTSGLASVIVGALMIIISVSLLFYNEGRAVQTSKSLEEGLDLVFHLGTTEVAFRENNGRLVYLTGALNTEKPLTDPEFTTVSVDGVKLKRTVWMYQWLENQSKREIDRGDHIEVETSYSYYTDWKDHLINSRQFDNPHNHQNPSLFSISSSEQVNNPVRVGNFILSQSQLNQISNYKVYQLDSTSKFTSANKWHVYDNHMYIGANPQNPKVGDIKIQFSYAGSTLGNNPDHVSIIAQQRGTTFIPYQTNAGDTLDFLYMGYKTAEEIFKSEADHNAMMTWALRGAGWLLMFIAFNLTTNIINVLVSWIPIVRDLIAFGTLSLSFALASSLSALVIALGWIRYRPWVSATVLLIAASPTILNWIWRRNHTARTNKNKYT